MPRNDGVNREAVGDWDVLGYAKHPPDMGALCDLSGTEGGKLVEALRKREIAKKRWNARQDAANSDRHRAVSKGAYTHSDYVPKGEAEAFQPVAVGFEEIAAASVGGNGIGRPYGPFVACRKGNGLAVWTRVPQPRRFTGRDALAGTVPAPPIISKGLDASFEGDASLPNGGRNVSLYNILAGRPGARDANLSVRPIASKMNWPGVDAVRLPAPPLAQPLPSPARARTILHPPPLMNRPHQPYGEAPHPMEIAATFLTELPEYNHGSALPPGLRISVGDGLAKAHLLSAENVAELSRDGSSRGRPPPTASTVYGRLSPSDMVGPTPSPVPPEDSAEDIQKDDNGGPAVPDGVAFLMQSPYAPLAINLPREAALPRPGYPTRAGGLKPLLSPRGMPVS